MSAARPDLVPLASAAALEELALAGSWVKLAEEPSTRYAPESAAVYLDGGWLILAVSAGIGYVATWHDSPEDCLDLLSASDFRPAVLGRKLVRDAVAELDRIARSSEADAAESRR